MYNLQRKKENWITVTVDKNYFYLFFIFFLILKWEYLKIIKVKEVTIEVQEESVNEIIMQVWGFKSIITSFKWRAMMSWTLDWKIFSMWLLMTLREAEFISNDVKVDVLSWLQVDTISTVVRKKSFIWSRNEW